MSELRPPRSWQPLRSRWRGVTAFGAVDRVAMLRAARRLRGGDEVGRTVASAAARTAIGRFSSSERELTRRVDRRGRHVFSMHSSVAPLWGRFLFALVRDLGPANAIELGTSWGVSSSYQAAALELNGDGRLMTFEGNAEWARHARELFEMLDLGERVEQRVGMLEDTLAPALAELGSVDFAYIDADHEQEPNRRYLETILPHAAEGAVLVFDDIPLDSEMRRAWEMVRSHDRVAWAVSVHRMGVAFVPSADRRSL